MPVALEHILPHIPLFLMVMFRLLGIFVFGPIFSMAAIPLQLRILLGLTLTFCLYPMIPVQTPMELSLATLSLAIGSEMLIGIIIGYGASMPLLGLQIGGLMIGHQLGLGLSRVYDPEMGEETEILGQLMFFIAMVVFVILDGHHVMIHILVRSFQTIPLGGYVPDGQWLQLLCGLLNTMFALAVRLAAPVLCLIFLETIAMGFIARTVPGINIMSIGFPLRIIIGLFAMIAVIAAQFNVVIEVIQNTLGNMMKLFS